MKRTTSGNIEKYENQLQQQLETTNDDQTSANNADGPPRTTSFENEDGEESFSLTKSAIDDLPSTAVQSIHLEIPEGQPSLVENVDEEVFVWKEFKYKLNKIRKQQQQKSSLTSNVKKQSSTMTKPQRITTNSGNVIAAKSRYQQQTPPKRHSSQQNIQTSMERNRSLQRLGKNNNKANSKERRDNNRKNLKRK